MTKTKKWIDGEGNEVPAKYVAADDKARDRVARKYLKQAEETSRKLRDLKTDLLNECDNLYEQMLSDNGISPDERLGNFTISSFDRSIKIEVSQDTRIVFNDKIHLVQRKLNEFIDQNTQGVPRFIRNLVNKAFETNKGQLDPKRIFALQKEDVDHPQWKEAMDLLNQSYNREKSKRYVRIWKRNPEGEYESIELNFSSMKV